MDPLQRHVRRGNAAPPQDLRQRRVRRPRVPGRRVGDQDVPGAGLRVVGHVDHVHRVQCELRRRRADEAARVFPRQRRRGRLRGIDHGHVSVQYSSELMRITYI